MGEGRIVQDPAILVGKPVIRGTRISVELILELLANDLDASKIVDAYPHVTYDDIRACLEYAGAVIAQDIVPQPWQRFDLPIPKSARNKHKIMALAGAWADLEADALIDYIYAQRHAAPPSPPVRFE